MEVLRKNIVDALMTVLAVTALGVLGFSRQGSTASSSAPINVYIGAAAAPRVQATIYSAPWCGPCKPYVKAVEDELPKQGFVVRKSTDPDASMAAHLILNKEEDQATLKAARIDSYPTTVIRIDGKEVKRWVGRVPTSELIKAMRDAAKSAK